MSWIDSFKEVGGAGLWTAAAGAGGWFFKEIVDYFRESAKRKTDIEKTEIEKKPDLDRIWKDGMVDLVRELKAEIASQRDTLAELRDEVADLNEHVDNLTSVLKANNITPPPRRKRSATASSEITG